MVVVAVILLLLLYKTDTSSFIDGTWSEGVVMQVSVTLLSNGKRRKKTYPPIPCLVFTLFIDDFLLYVDLQKRATKKEEKENLCVFLF